MSQKNNRRDFLSKLVLGASSVAAAPFLGMSSTTKHDMNRSTELEPVLRIRPLGFQWETADPFLFCVHHEDDYPEGNEELGPTGSLAGRQIGSDFHLKDGWRMYHGKTIPGFPGHPHRGFETITVVRKGLVDHADSMGASGRYGNGDVQWMTAGKGVQHSEMFPLLKQDKRNPLELFQIWLNLPQRNKMVEPHFKMLWSENIPHLEHEDSEGRKTTVEIIAGSLYDKTAATPPPDSWAADPKHCVGVFNCQLEPHAKFILPATEPGINRTLYFYEGSGLTISGKTISDYHAADVQPDMDLTLENNSNEMIKILVLQGQPINEPVVQHGPFVMNSRQEIQQAFEDYHATQFGGWPWPRYDQVHDRNKGRFARHADGHEEVRS